VRRFSSPIRARGFRQHDLELAAVDRILRPVEARGAASFFLPNELAEFVEEAQCLGRRAEPGQGVAQPQFS